MSESKEWEKFEIECVNYLNEKFGNYACFSHNGGANSTVSDILVETKNKKTFYIDVKFLPSQCGQFVLIPNKRTSVFEYSPKNKTLINSYSLEIINYMNSLFNEYSKAGTAGIDINMPNGDEIFSAWIINMYNSKNTNYFITNGFNLFPINKILDYLIISAKYRVKKSGSANVGLKKIDEVLNYIDNNFHINNFNVEKDKLFVSSDTVLNGLRFMLNEHEYMFSSKENKEYEIRRLSNTYNANVIFSITSKKSFDGISDLEFVSELVS